VYLKKNFINIFCSKVVASKTASEECITYYYANFKKGGLLIDTFNKGGSKEVVFFYKR